MKNLNSTRIIVKLRCAYVFQCASTWHTSNEDYFALMTEALYEFSIASWKIQKEVMEDLISRACIAAWITHTYPCATSAMANHEEEEEIEKAYEQDAAIAAFMKEQKNFTPENVLNVLYWTWNNCIDWTDQTMTLTPDHREIGIFLGKHYGTRRRHPHVPKERRIRGAH